MSDTIPGIDPARKWRDAVARIHVDFEIGWEAENAIRNLLADYDTLTARLATVERERDAARRV